MFNHLSLEKKKKNFENVLFPINMGDTLPFKICFSKEQKSFTLREHKVT